MAIKNLKLDISAIKVKWEISPLAVSPLPCSDELNLCMYHAGPGHQCLYNFLCTRHKALQRSTVVQATAVCYVILRKCMCLCIPRKDSWGLFFASLACCIGPKWMLKRVQSTQESVEILHLGPIIIHGTGQDWNKADALSMRTERCWGLSFQRGTGGALGSCRPAILQPTEMTIKYRPSR